LTLCPFLRWLGSLLLEWLLGSRLGRSGQQVLLPRTVLGPVTRLSTVETVALEVGTGSGRGLLLKESIGLSSNPWVSRCNHVSKV
jgi:hypothetical protein